MTEATSLEERIARIIDPSSWAVLDGYLAEVKRKYRGQNAEYDPSAFKDKGSLAKAREIRALITPIRSPASAGLAKLRRAYDAWQREEGEAIAVIEAVADYLEAMK